MVAEPSHRPHPGPLPRGRGRRGGRYRASLLAIVLASCATTAICDRAASASDLPPPDGIYLAELVTRADSLGLAEHAQWLALVHYQPRRFGGWQSTADSAWFFQSPVGRREPRAELHATLARLFDAGQPMKDGEPPQCALRARYRWLDAQLRFDPARLPPQPCDEYEAWRRGLAGEGITLVFPEAYMNNPSSMFGHTLLRIDAGPPGARKDLLAYGTNFSADTGNDGGVAFAFKGILGFYPGRFAILPYYDIVKQYGDWEQRDIWEYQLTLDPSEVDLLLAHLWELRGVEFDYYFFDENCSYQLLALLDATRPDLRLQEQFRAWVIPADTVRAVVAQPGLIAGVTYRPSAGTRLRDAARELSSPQRRLASAVADGDVAPDDAALASESDRERAAVLGTAYELFRIRYLTGRESTQADQERARAILLARSRVPVEGSALPPVPTPAVRPDQGHRSSRAAAGTGVRNGQFYLEARIRPSYHDLMDPVGGYTAGAQIEFFDLTFRYYTKHRDPRVHRFTLVDVVSIAPVDAFFFPVSWKAGTGLFSRLVPDRSDDLEEEYVWRTAGGAGLAIEPWSNGLAYALIDATIDYSPALEEDHAIGPGASAGVFFGPGSDRWRGQLFATVTRFALGDVSTFASGGVEGRLTLTPQMALKASIAGFRDFDQSWIEGGVEWNVYF